MGDRCVHKWSGLTDALRQELDRCQLCGEPFIATVRPEDITYWIWTLRSIARG